MKKNIIVWDLGATKCQVGLVEYDTDTHQLFCRQKYCEKLVSANSLIDLINQLEVGLGVKMSTADAICIGAAGQYNGEMLLLEGVYPYAMPFAKIAKQLQWPAFEVIHDYSPIVCATFTSYLHNANNVKRLNTAAIQSDGRRVALGLGTGLGLKDGVLFANGDFWLGRNEIGHIGITTPPDATPVELQRHSELIQFLQEHIIGPVTFEKLLSGPGTVRLHQFFYPDVPVFTPEEVGSRHQAGAVSEMVDAFAWYMGLFVGTVQLIFMPEGGVWITGGVALHYLDAFDRPDFLAGIQSSPAYYVQREQYPLGVLCNLEHALIGGGYYAAHRLLK